MAENLADFDPTKKYRYTLRRHLSWAKPRLKFTIVMLNPSTADAVENDPTTRICMRIAKKCGCTFYTAVNCFAWRSPHPKDLLECEDPIGPDNDEHIVREVSDADIVVVAWGNGGSLFGRSEHVRELLFEHTSEVFCLDINKTGEPHFPLYLKKEITLRPFNLLERIK